MSEEYDIYEPISVKLKEKLKNLNNLKLRKSKGRVDLDYEENPELENLYRKVDELEPFGEFPFPKWNFYFLVANFGLGSPEGETSGLKYHLLPEFYETYLKTQKKVVPLTLYRSVSSAINLTNTEIYEKIVKPERKYRVTFFGNNLPISGLEEFINYREGNSKVSFGDDLTFVELKKFVIGIRRPIDEIQRENLLKVYPKINYQVYSENICNLDNLEYVTGTLSKTDIIFISTLFYSWKARYYQTFMNSQLIFSLIIVSIDHLEKSGSLVVNIADLNHKLLTDTINLLTYFFDKVTIFKSAKANTMRPYKSIICEGFQGASEKDKERLVEILKDWNSLDDMCALNFKTVDKEKTYPKSFLDTDLNDFELETFFQLEEERRKLTYKKIIDAYYYVKFGGPGAEESLIYKKIQRTIRFLQLHKVEISKKYEESSNSRVLELDFKMPLGEESYTFSEKSEEVMISLEDKKYQFPKILNAELRLRRLVRILDNFTEKFYYKIKKDTEIFPNIRDVISKKFCFDKPVSQGFLKMYEILTTFPLLNKNLKNHKTFHLCESPGQFILATNHYLMTKTKCENFVWKAQSLNPKLEKNKGALKDSYGLIKKFPNHWDFGIGETGDITSIKNMRYYMERIKEADLVTFDCGSGFSPDEELYQDRAAFKLNFSQILIVLGGMKLGGSAVFKVFLPQSQPGIISLNYLLNISFKSFTFYKPKINPQSQEVYLVCQSFLGFDKEGIDILIKMKPEELLDRYFFEIPETFVEDYDSCISQFVQKNIETFDKIYYYRENFYLLKQGDKIRMKNIGLWIEYFGIEKIKKNQLL